MASAIVLQATTVEGQLAEILHHITDLEQDLATNPSNLRNVQGKWIVTNEEFTFQGTFLVRTTGTVDDQGRLVLTAVEYLTDSNTGV